MKEREIGSEFWNFEKGKGHKLPKKTYLSGRTALTAIILELKKEGIKEIGLPDYLCESMIEPFLRQKMKIGFYPIQRNKEGLDIPLETIRSFEAVLLVNFFGFMNDQIKTVTLECQQLGVKTIVDLTHDVLSNPANYLADYIFGSYRKWTGIEIGFAAGNRVDQLTTWPVSNEGTQYLSLREQAREVKRLFVSSGYKDEKLRHTQLDLFERAEELLDREYISDTDDENKERLISLDFEYIKNRRKENASVIYSQIQQISSCVPMFHEIPDNATPLAVPILLPKESRNSLRTYLRKHGIFCPVHWPITALHRAEDSANSIYSSEISLVCDQRYDAEDMTYIMEMIKQWERITSE